MLSLFFAPLLLALAAATSTTPLDEAAWLRDPRMADAPIIDLLLKEKVPVPELAGPRNIHTLYRHEVTLREAPQRAVLWFTADDFALVYANGAQVAEGPAPGYRQHHYYLELDITPQLRAGVNTLAAHAYYQGLRNRVWNSADNRSGFALRLDVRYADGTTVRFSTDETWRCFALLADPDAKTIGYQTQFAEEWDLRTWPEGWREAGFDDRAWQTPLTGRQDHTLVPQPTPPLRVYALDPVQVVDKGKGNYFYDMGRYVVGRTHIAIAGSAGDTIIVEHGEELRGPEQVRSAMRANCLYREEITLREGTNAFAFYAYKGFRYIEISGAKSPPQVQVLAQHHPLPAQPAGFDSTDPGLNGIWQISAESARWNTQGVIVDCPTREKGQYLGDAVIAARTHGWLTGEASAAGKALEDFAQSRRICPGIMAVAPGSFMQEIAEYSLQYPLLLARYHQFAGDPERVRKWADAVLPGLFDYFACFENESGLLVGVEAEKWVLVDWPDNLRDGFDYEYAKGKPNAVLNAFYYGALTTAADLYEELDRDGSAWRAKAERVAAAFGAAFADPARGLYVDAPGSAHVSLHANAIPLYFGLTTGASREAILDLIRERGLACGVYIASYVIEACFRVGEPELGWALLNNDSEHSWREMLRHGALTSMEAWGPDQKKNTSWCHAWSSSPVYILIEHVFGIRPGASGFRQLQLAPARIEGLPKMYITLPGPRGRIEAEYAPETGFTYTIPEGLPVDIAPDAPVAGVNRSAAAARALTPEEQRYLNAHGWGERVGDAPGIWVDVPTQRLRVVQGAQVLWEVVCATAAKGTGSIGGSLQTPLGWHEVTGKIGDGAPWGQVFRSRAATKEIWKPGDNVTEDMVLTRILILDGREPGRNQGRDAEGRLVDSRERFIYVHGTNGEAVIGSPSSHGCIRLLNDDVITLFDRTAEGTMLLITEGEPQA